jgi:hypothetical protein
MLKWCVAAATNYDDSFAALPIICTSSATRLELSTLYIRKWFFSFLGYLCQNFRHSRLHKYASSTV